MSEESFEDERPRISTQEWIDVNDFRQCEEIDTVRTLYQNRTQANELLNKTYVDLERAEEVNGWSKRKKKHVCDWQNELEYLYTVNWFFLYELKDMEGFWSWVIIVISTITSTLSLIDLDSIGWFESDLWVKGATSAFSVATTLIAAWIKKENYVERIKNIDRYIQRISKLNKEIGAVISKPSWDRLEYTKFLEIYEPQTTRLLADPPPMSPEELKGAVWKLTKFYPELVKDTYPWYEKDEIGEYIVTHWGQDILRTYDAVYYKTCVRKVCGLYYCKCKCCRRKPNIAEVYKPSERTRQKQLSLWPVSSRCPDRRDSFVPTFELGRLTSALHIGSKKPDQYPTGSGKITELTRIQVDSGVPANHEPVVVDEEELAIGGEVKQSTG